jgi:serine phosphatase RsbU (regulator of sigma subunit)
LPFNLRAALIVSFLAGAGCLGILALGAAPPVPSSIVLFTVAPVCALLALPVVSGRARAEGDLPLEWFSGGLAVAGPALVLQLISFPVVAGGGGPLGTGGEGSAALYLTFHAWPYGCALAGALGAGRRALWPAWIAGAAAAVLQAMNLFPIPDLITADATYTPALLVADWTVVGLGLVAVVAWVRACGRFPTPLRGWVGVWLMFSLYELIFNAIAGRRYGVVWWASLSLRAAGYAALAVGGLIYLLRQSRRVEQFSAAELALRDTELRGSPAVTERLLMHSRELARSYTPEQVAATLCTTVAALTGTARVAVGHRDPPGQPGMRLLAWRDGVGAGRSTGTQEDEQEEGEELRLPATATRPTYLSSRSQIERELPPAEWSPPGIRSLAVLPVRVGELIVGVLVAQERHPRVWSGADRDLLEAVADQSGPVLSRARLAAREHLAAETLQRSLLPPRLPVVPGLTLTARYQPAGREEQVGGDWYDGWALPDGRLALVIGDVVGKGLGAAAATGRLRASVRALALRDPSPARVLTQLHQIEAEDSPDIVATVLYALFDADLTAVRIARAGHPPAVVVHADGVAELLDDDPGTPIGLAVAPMSPCRVPLESGSTIILYTDGLVEDRLHPLQDRLLDLLTADQLRLHPGDPDDLASHLMAHFRTTHEDDVALLVASCTHGVLPPNLSPPVPLQGPDPGAR